MNTTAATPTSNPTGLSERPPIEWPPRSHAERDALRDQAIERAHALRAEAIADFWRGSGAWIVDAIDHTRRAADRLAARLRQHAKRRAACHSGAAEV